MASKKSIFRFSLLFYVSSPLFYYADDSIMFPPRVWTAFIIQLYSVWRIWNAYRASSSALSWGQSAYFDTLNCVYYVTTDCPFGLRKVISWENSGTRD